MKVKVEDYISSSGVLESISKNPDTELTDSNDANYSQLLEQREAEIGGNMKMCILCLGIFMYLRMFCLLLTKITHYYNNYYFKGKLPLK